jgi:hypothetical protein
VKTLLAMWSVLLLSGCWFVYIPSGIFDSRGSYCVPETAMVGSKIRMSDGREGVVKSLAGRSDRCQDGRIPIRADVDFPV